MPGRRRQLMPYKPKRPCSYPGCPRLTSGRYCEEHQKIITAHYNKHQRDPASKRRYGRAWKRIRDRYIAAHPLCEQCRRAGSPNLPAATAFAKAGPWLSGTGLCSAGGGWTSPCSPGFSPHEKLPSRRQLLSLGISPRQGR